MIQMILQSTLKRMRIASLRTIEDLRNAFGSSDKQTVIDIAVDIIDSEHNDTTLQRLRNRHEQTAFNVNAYSEDFVLMLGQGVLPGVPQQFEDFA